MRQLQTRSTRLYTGIVKVLRTSALAATFALSVSTTALAQTNGRANFDIPEQSLSGALKAFAEQAGMQLLYRPETVNGATVRPLRGDFDKRQALQRLLEGTDLEVVYSADNAATIRPRGREPATPEDNTSRASTAVSAGAWEAHTGGAAATTDEAQPALMRSGRAQDLETVTVTGTRIRGGTSPSPVITIGAEHIRQEGFTDLGEVIRSVPQNFGGGQNPGVLMGNMAGAGHANQNITGGSGLNLRGLGPDASLTLLNGRRLAYSGFVQAVDISAIPVEAVDRIEVMADGASALYGSDAVGGVANVILKRDFNGVSAGVRHGTTAGGGGARREYTATAGSTWSSGGLIATVQDVSAQPIYASQRAFTRHLNTPQMLLPDVDQRSALLSVHQAVGESVELGLDAVRSERDQFYTYYGANPAVYNRWTPETTTTFLAPSIAFALPGTWSLSLAGVWGRDEHRNPHARINVQTGAPTLLIDECFCNRSRMYEVTAEGPLFALPAGDARVALGAGQRSNEFLWNNLLTGTPSIQSEAGSRFAYAELNLPLLRPAAGAEDARRLELTAAMRAERHDAFGSVSTPKVGVVYSPNASLTLKSSWGRSFKAPTLFQLYREQLVQLTLAAELGGAAYPADATVLVFGGGNPDLDPERARTWTTSAAWHPRTMPGLEMELTWFDIDYTERVVEPITNYSQALADPIFVEFVHRDPTPDEQAAVIAAADRMLNFAGAPYDPGRVVAILQAQYVNASEQRIRGLDLSGTYRLDLAAGRLAFRGSASWLDSAQRVSTSAYDLSGTLHNPAKLNARLGALWSSGGFEGSLFANHAGGVVNRVSGVRTASFTTFDTTLRYVFADSAGAWSGLDLAVTASNLLGRDPPLYVPAGAHVPPYDSTNYSPVGRFVTLSLSKRW